MIDISKISKNKPNNEFVKLYCRALDSDQKIIQGMAISTFNKEKNEVDSRFVNLKYIIEDEWIFFSNYKSRKAKDIETHNQISAVFHWQDINTQIRIKAHIKKTSKTFSDLHFKSRTNEKNALAISSNQSGTIDSYSSVVKNYENVLKSKSSERPYYWGGYSFTPYYFEFWEGHNSRLNKRNAYEMKGGDWNHFILQP